MNVPEGLSPSQDHDLKDMTARIQDGQSLSITVPANQVDNYLRYIKEYLGSFGAPTPIILDLESSSIQDDIQNLIDKVYSFPRPPNEFKRQNPRYNIWVNLDKMLEQHQNPRIKSVGKYAKNIFLFGHPIYYETISEQALLMLGECDSSIDFTWK